jgi:hypothetical protein
MGWVFLVRLLISLNTDDIQISTVTNVVDSRTALEDSKTTIKQGNNIRVLTLITIVYLPLGFVTVC